jgi:hypothetical protein
MIFRDDLSYFFGFLAFPPFVGISPKTATYMQSFRAILATYRYQKYGYETTGRPAVVTVIAVDARSRA